MRIERLDETTRKNLLEDLLKRSPNSYGTYEASVREILDEVKNRRDEAVFAYTEKFDGAALNADNIQVTEEEIQKAYSQVDSSLLDVIRKSLKNIESYHAKQMQYSWFDSKPDGTILGQKVTPLQKVGVYVPGGKAVYPSSVLMNIVPAKVAGVDEIIMVTPPGKDGKVNPATLVAAKEAGVDAVYKVGGAHYRISNRCTEVFHIETIRAASDLLVRRKSNADLAVRDLRVAQEIFCHRHDLRHACLVVGAQKRGSVSYDQILTF